jgi:beta-phosphoglucomutase-like phosphatase (HAD superfamily)
LIKAIFFDLDGVLIDMVENHYKALNMALKEICNYEITNEEHIKYYNGISTEAKLKMLINRGIVDKKDYAIIWASKQKYTSDLIDSFKEDEVKIDMCKKLKDKDHYKLACISNSIKNSTNKMCNQIGIFNYLDLILGNEDFKEKIKPDPYPYQLGFQYFNLLPKECVIVEDSPKGLQSAYASNANVLKVKDPTEVTYENIMRFINELRK